MGRFYYILLVMLLPLSVVYSSESLTSEPAQSQISSIDIAKDNIEKRIQKRQTYFESLLKNLGSISSTYHMVDDDKLYAYFDFVQNVWREFVKRSFSNISSQFLQGDLPDLGDVKGDASLISDEELKSVSKHYTTFDRWLNTQIDLDQDSYNRVLLISGQTRSQLMQEFEFRGIKHTSLFRKGYFQDLSKEIQVIPTRWAATIVCKIYDWKRNIDSGIKGWKTISTDLFLFALIVLITVFFSLKFQDISSSIEERADLIASRIRLNQQKAWRFIFYLINRSIPWLIIALLIKFLIYIVDMSSVNEVSEVFAIFGYYIYYKLTLAIITHGLTRLKVDGTLKFSYRFYKKLFRTIRYTCLMFLSYFTMLSVINAVVGKALFYRLTDMIFLLFVGVFFIQQLWSWRFHINHLYRKQLFLGGVVYQFVSRRALLRPIRPLIQLVGILKFFFFYLISNLMSGTRFADWLSSYLFIQKVKRSKLQDLKEYKGERASIEEAYLAKLYSTPHNFFITPPGGEKVVQLIEEWLEEDSDTHTLSIVGPNGSGKTSFVKYIESKVHDYPIINLSLQEKCWNLTAFYHLLSEAMNQQITSSEGLVEALLDLAAENKKLIVVIDNAHHLFFSTVDGFSIIKELIRLMGRSTLPVFWITTYSAFSWNYLKQVFSRSELSQEEIIIQPWDKEEIRGFIQSRHEQTGFHVSFEELGLALKVTAEHELRDVEDKYFTFLTNVSKGNPQSALMMWIHSLYPSDEEKTLNIRLPRSSVESDRLEEIGEHEAFVLAAVAKHGSLTKTHINQVVNIGEGAVGQSVKKLVSLDLLEYRADRYLFISPEFLGDVQRILKRYYLVYE